jgi:hypothetical protein
MGELVLQEVIENKIYLIRGHKVMLDKDLAGLYGVSVKRLNEQVRRNIKRFPADFMFQLNDRENEILKSQFATSSWGGARRANLHAFTEQGVAMLSSVLNSERAIQVNIAIMRAFVKLKKNLVTYKKLSQKIGELERKVGKHDEDILIIFEAIKRLMEPPPVPPKPRIGFHP